MNTNIHIRKATLTDTPILHNLTDQLGYSVSEKQITLRMETILASREHQVLVAVNHEEAPVGWIHGYVRTLLVVDKHIDIGGLVVAIEHRSQGIGEQLLKAIETWAQGEGVSAVRIASNVSRAQAHDFYLRHGYTHVKDSKVFHKLLSV